MTTKQNYIKSIILIMSIALMILSGCTRKIDGSYILSLKEVKGYQVNYIQITFYKVNNRIDSPSITLSSKQERDQLHIQSFIDIIENSDEIEGKDEIAFSPPSQSSHRIVITFDNEFVLEFYYSNDNNWLIWSNSSEQEGKKILQYYFLTPTSSMQEWLTAIESEA